MCNTYPCTPTAGEAAKLINEGYAKRLMLKAWPAKNNPKIVIPCLCPAIVGHEMGIGPLKMHEGPCTFFKNERCELHNLNLKPAEGRFATHDTTPEQESEKMFEIMKTWTGDYGDYVFNAWIEICEVIIQGPGFTEPNRYAELPSPAKGDHSDQ